MPRPLLAIALVAVACAPELDDSTPEGATALFLAALARSENDRDALREAYELMDSDARQRLAERARSVTALGARELEPWEMIVEGRAIVRFVPRRGSGLRARPGAAPDEAIVSVVGEDERQQAEIALRREEGRWRVVFPVPDPRATSGAAEASP